MSRIQMTFVLSASGAHSRPQQENTYPERGGSNLSCVRTERHVVAPPVSVMDSIDVRGRTGRETRQTDTAMRRVMRHDRNSHGIC